MARRKFLKKSRSDDNFEVTEQGYREALQIRCELARANPAACLPDLARALTDLALIQMAKNDFAGAAQGYHEALQIYRELVGANPAVYLPDVAGTLDGLALVQQAANDSAAAGKSYREALRIYRELAKTDPKLYLLDVAISLINLGIFYQQSVPDKAKSLDYLVAAYRVLNSITDNHPAILRYRQTVLQAFEMWGGEPDENRIKA